MSIGIGTNHSRVQGAFAPAGDASEYGLIARSVAGDAEAFGSLAIACQDRVFNVCLRMIGNRADAEELTQQAFLAAYSAIRGFDGRSSFYTWLYRIAVNLCLSLRRRPDHREGAPCVETFANEDARRSEASASPVDAAQTREIHARVLEELNRLDPDHRAVMVLRDLEGMDYDAIAAALNVPRGTVKSRLHRAREALRRALSPMMNECEP